jgi:hypothetical protein
MQQAGSRTWKAGRVISKSDEVAGVLAQSGSQCALIESTVRPLMATSFPERWNSMASMNI